MNNKFSFTLKHVLEISFHRFNKYSNVKGGTFGTLMLSPSSLKFLVFLLEDGKLFIVEGLIR